MANEVCDREAGICRHVKGPTPNPKLFAPTKAPQTSTRPGAPAPKSKSENEELRVGSPADAAGSPAAPVPSPALAPAPAPAPGFTAPAPAPSVALQPPPDLASNIPLPLGGSPPPNVPPPKVPSNVRPNMVEHYTFFYYVYYYYAYLGRKDAGLSDSDAAAHAQKMAPVYAAEQLQHMLEKAPSTPSAARAPSPSNPLPPFVAFHGITESAMSQQDAWQQALAAAGRMKHMAKLVQDQQGYAGRKHSALRGVLLSLDQDVLS